MKKLYALLLGVALTLSGCSSANTDTMRSDSEIVTASLNNQEVSSKPENSSEPSDDCWAVASPEDCGMDPQILNEMDEYIVDSLPSIRSVLIVRNGRMVFEKYYQGLDRNDKSDICSVTKTLTSALIGIAIKNGLIKGVDQKVSDFFPKSIGENSQEQLKDMTIEHLLTMTSGWKWDEMSNLNEVYSALKDIGYMFKLPFVSNPGEKFQYNTGSSQVLSAIITKVTKMTEEEYAKVNLFEPLGIKEWYWPQGGGYSYGGLGLGLKARDMAKIGYLFLQNGNWNGSQIIPSEWIAEISAKRNNGGAPESVGYAYHCWTMPVKNHPSYFAAGYGGQYIFIIPELNMVTVIKSNCDAPHIANRGIMNRFIVPAVLQQ